MAHRRVASGSSAAEAMIHLFDRDGDFVLVTDPTGALRGVVAPRDFAVSPTTAGVSSTTAAPGRHHGRAGRPGAARPRRCSRTCSRGGSEPRVISVYSARPSTPWSVARSA